MKKLIFSAIVMIIILLSVESKATCPFNYQGPFTVSIQLSPTCTIEAEWCCGDVITLFGIKKGIHFSEIRIIGDCTNYITYSQDQFGNLIPTIPWDELVGGVITSGEGCFTEAPDLEPCIPPDPSDFGYIITNGGCYRYINELNIKRYVPCDPDQVAYCYEQYRICWEYLNPGYKIHVIGQNQQPTFQCESQDCFPLCPN